MNRQDRYVRFVNCPDLADYFSSLVNVVASHSFKLKPDGNAEKPSAVPTDPLLSRRAARVYKESLAGAVKGLNRERSNSEGSEEDCDGADTLVYPLVQMGSYGIRDDEVVTRRLLEGPRGEDRLFLASGYFNLPAQYTNAIFRGNGECTILAASPQVRTECNSYVLSFISCLPLSLSPSSTLPPPLIQANGFYGAKGVAGHVPYMYIHFATRFLQAISKQRCEDRVKYLEYFREGWTYHGKGTDPRSRISMISTYPCGYLWDRIFRSV